MQQALTKGGCPEHLLWMLYFLKVYSKQGLGCLVVGATAGAINPKTHRKWVWAFIKAITKLVNVVVSSVMPPPATAKTMGLRWQSGDGSPYHARKALAAADSASDQVPDSRHLVGGDAGVFHLAQLRHWPRRENRAPTPAPDSAAWRHIPSNPIALWAARSWAAPASAPLDGDNGTPGWGRLCPSSSGVDHQ